MKHDVPLYPLPFAPFFRPMPWGGRRLEDWVNAPLPVGRPIGEAWLLSDHSLHHSIVSAGSLAGVSIRNLIENRSEELLGFRASRLPLLVKLLDANENLSVQVHPDDDAARIWAPSEGGKTEAWWVLDTVPGATIYLGLKSGVNRAALERELPLGTVPLLLRRHEPRPGNCYFVPAGTIHGIGGGVLLLEVQQTSDATFRLYDWDRVDEKGQPRQLHLEAGLDCIKEVHAPLEPKPTPTDNGGLRLVQCPYFSIIRREVTELTQFIGPIILVILKGHGSFPREHIDTSCGSTLVVPAVPGQFEFHPAEPCLLAEIRFN